MEPPKDVKKEGTIWRLNKPWYGLNYILRKFWLKSKEVFEETGMMKLKGRIRCMKPCPKQCQERLKVIWE